jgi:hypothetical protein
MKNIFQKSVFILLIVGITPLLLGNTEIEERLLEDQTDTDASEILELLQSFHDHPIDLNRVSIQKLQSFPLISPMLARLIIHNRSLRGPFLSWTDFLSRIRIEENIFSQIKPYMKISEIKIKKKYIASFRTRIQKQLIKSQGYRTGVYPGSPSKIYNRTSFDFGKIFRCGFLLEKDPGEEEWYDHFVGYIETESIIGLNKLIIGHFRVETGQGLVLWGPYGLSKGANPVAPAKKRAKGIRGYTYSDENHYFTGVGLETQLGNTGLILFSSNTTLDATLNPDGSVKSFLPSGLHRTHSEIQNQNVFQEYIYGGKLTLYQPWGAIGITGWAGKYSKDIEKKDSELYRFYFRESKNNVLGLDYDLYWGLFNFSGEIARSQSKGLSFIGNIVMEFNNISFALVIRHFESDFQNPHSSGFGTTDSQNENGVYMGFGININQKTRISLYYDFFRHPWRTFFIPAPTRGDDLFTQIDHSFSSNLSILIRTRLRTKEAMNVGLTSWNREIDFLQNRNHRLYRLEIQYRASSKLRFKSRLELINIEYPKIIGEISLPQKKENGFLFYQDLRIKPCHSVTLSVRWITFETDSYDSRVYAFENDLSGVLSIKPLYGRGTKCYLLFQYRLLKKLTLHAKWSIIYHDYVDSWGSGNDTIKGDTDRHIGIQCDLKL